MIGQTAWQLLVYAGMIAAILTGTLVVNRFETSPRPPRHEDRPINEILVATHVGLLLWIPVATASTVAAPGLSLRFAATLIVAAIVTIPIQTCLWRQAEQRNPFGVLRPNPNRYDVFVDMGREEEYDKDPPIRVTTTNIRSDTDTDEPN